MSKAKDKFKRPVVVTALDGSTAQFESVNEAARQLRLDARPIFNVLKGRHRTHHGYAFEYAEEV